MPYNYATRLEKRRNKRKARQELKAVVANAFALDEADRRAQAANSHRPTQTQFNSQEPSDSDKSDESESELEDDSERAESEPDSERELVSENSEQSESEAEEELEQELQEIVRAKVQETDFEEILVDFMFRHRISHAAMHDLLAIFNSFNSKPIPPLPRNPRTLLAHQASKVKFVEQSAQFVYLGLSRMFSYLLINHEADFLAAPSINMAFNFDGLELTNSTSAQLWPILLNTNIAREYVHVVGAFYGTQKPSPEELLSSLVTDLKHVLDNGFEYKRNGAICHKPVVLEYIVCDLPAMAIVKGIKGHGGYGACPKCSVYGKRVEGRTSYIPRQHNEDAQFYMDAPFPKPSRTIKGPDGKIPWKNKPIVLVEQRTDSTFRMKTDKRHHNVSSPLLELYIDMIECFTLDGMHCAHLNGLKRFMTFLKGEKGTHVGRLISQSAFLSLGNEYAKATYPREFTRCPRNFDHYEKWKATELRMFLLYGGDVLVRSSVVALQPDLVTAFQSFSMSIRILSDPTLYMACHLLF